MLLLATVLVPAGTVGEVCFELVVALRRVEPTVVEIAMVVVGPAPTDAGSPGQAAAAAMISSETEVQTLW